MFKFIKYNLNTLKIIKLYKFMKNIKTDGESWICKYDPKENGKERLTKK